MLNITPSTSQFLKQLAAEILLSKTNKVNKISDNSVVSGVSYSLGKVAQKCEKDITLALSQLFPDTSFGSALDQVAQNFGIAPRFGATNSLVAVKVVGTPGTTYTAGVNTFTSTTGKQFTIQKTTIIGSFGFNYVYCRSTDTGTAQNVASGTISTVTPTPSGHQFCVNEYQASGALDAEDDITFAQRIKDGPNILARGTVASYEQAFKLINPNILSVRYQGINGNGQLKLAILTQSGIALNTAEINTLLESTQDFLSLSEIKPFGRNSYGVQIVNINIQPLDISFRCQLLPSANVTNVIIAMQTAIGKYIDPRFFQVGVSIIDWTVLLQIVRNVTGVQYVPDAYFYPNADIQIDPNSQVRLRGFELLDLNGVIINNQQGSLNPVFYNSPADFSYVSTALKSL